MAAGESHYNTIKCADKGTETEEDRETILNALIYCDAHDEYEPKQVKKALDNKYFGTSIVIEGHSNFSGNLATWSRWTIGDHKFTIFRLHSKILTMRQNLLTSKNLIVEEYC